MYGTNSPYGQYETSVVGITRNVHRTNSAGYE